MTAFIAEAFHIAGRESGFDPGFPQMGQGAEIEHAEAGGPVLTFLRRNLCDRGGEGAGPMPEGHGGNAQEMDSSPK